jgi:uncharacterized membrane protein (UPF0127 family)
MKKEILSLGVLIISAAGLYLLSTTMTPNEIAEHTFSFAGQVIEVELADDSIERTRGLSGRDSLKEGTGLLFVFDEPGQYGFWMKDMNFPIDILWFNEEKQLVGATKDISPDTFPETFYPEEQILYALETNVGEFTQLDDFIGQTFELSTVKSDN